MLRPRRLPAVLAAALLASPLARGSGPDGAEGVRARVLAGRSLLAAGGEVRVLSAASGAVATPGTAYAEVRAGGRLEVAWEGRGRLLVTGPAALEWDAGERQGPGAVRVARLGGIEAEARRGTLEIQLPGAWRLRLAAGAASLHGTPRGTAVRPTAGAIPGLVPLPPRPPDERAPLATGRVSLLPGS